MRSINNLIVCAEKDGREGAWVAHVQPSGAVVFPDNEHHPGEETGHLVLEAYRNYGVEVMKSVIRGYQAGYNARAQELGDAHVRWVQIKNGIAWALSTATDEEVAAIPDAM